ncbi:COP9 signalosome complex subunit 8 [Tribolium castaneum]|uniref:COP9 signalosome complex subunit 8 n=1 Tax=Tribolium castaneum TaxID=7070 RepID=D6WLE0_TRICA|nr:PREDICTED: COP9 signalosome complex subunit 8 [Tribolium castaneum]EFA04765.1 COP9 signalosome complex subunit 8-like Protein [Tribolium castaneum]|eukprot:XP_008193747.1 PREDICTED: COP9 signalosome complex subunit 8 [Tribolium castaneum]
MVSSNIEKLAEDLEKQELEAQNGIASPQVYEQLLAIYLYENDLCNAKYLWKRIPASVKSSTPELNNIWAVAQHMWKRDFPGIYKALNAVTWSDGVANIMKQVQDRVRNRSVDLIAQAYSSITLDTVSAMTGLPPDICATACVERGWQVEADTRMVHPVRPTPQTSGQTSSEDQLYKLTDFVSFLEN